MFPRLKFWIEDDRVTIEGLPDGLTVRGIKPGSKTLAELKHLSVASANIAAAKFYIDAIKTVTTDTDAHLFDAALLAAIVKYGSVFKPNSRGDVIDAAKIFAPKVRIINPSLSEETMEIDDPQLDLLKKHRYFIRLRDQVIAHDDRLIGNTECFAAFDAEFNCEHVVALTQRTSVYTAIKGVRSELPLCIDAVFTWLAHEKERYCQLVCDELNRLPLKRRVASPEPLFASFKGFPDPAARDANDPYWEYDWSTGKKRLSE